MRNNAAGKYEEKKKESLPLYNQNEIYQLHDKAKHLPPP
jgi:hypothetical protein